MKILTKSATSSLPARLTAAAVAVAGALLAVPAFADQVILDDLIVDGSICVGQDCVNGESFGFDTLRLKENKLRIKAQDTSTSASFPSTDWQITFNDSNNGGQNRFSVEDISASRVPFTIEGNAPNHSLYVDDGGRIGLGTSTPVVDIHVKSGNTPTLRLEQDGTSGFTAQTWDVAGNEANFFVRDATNGSTLPIRSEPGAPSNAIYIEDSGEIGFGTTSPDAALHRRISTDGFATLLHLENADDGAGGMAIRMTDHQTIIDFNNTGDEFRVNIVEVDGVADAGGPELTLSAAGDLVIDGTLTAGNPGQAFPDYVFESNYVLMPLDDLAAFFERQGHLPIVPTAEEVESSGVVNVSALQLTLLEKVEELTLYMIGQEKKIQELQARLDNDFRPASIHPDLQ